MYQKFRPVIRLIIALNALHKGIGDGILFRWRFAKDDLIIQAVPTDLAALMSLLWAHCLSYSFFFEQFDNHSAIRVTYSGTR